jgi:hypothetical protein
VAVEVGIGGFRPYPPQETLARRWGDCKDKALLLIDLAREVGIEAYPALVRLSGSDRADRHFPSPFGFNHLIVAVPAGAAAAAPEDPVAGGYLFIDATQTRGGFDWLNPGVQGQPALVVRPGAGELVETPVRPAGEAQRLIVNLVVSPDGTASGGVGLGIDGSLGDAFLELSATAAPERLEADLRSVLARLLPGASVGTYSLHRGEGAVPSVSLSAAVRIEGLVQGEGDRRSFVLPSFAATPEPRRLGERALPVALDAGLVVAEWKLRLPEGWCPPEAAVVETANGMGRFRQSVEPAGQAVVLKRETEVARRWAEPEELPAVRELALAEHRATKRRVRLECPGSP